MIVRHFSAPRISDYLRITVGTDGQIDRLLSALSDILAAITSSPDEPRTEPPEPSRYSTTSSLTLATPFPTIPSASAAE